MGLLVAGRLFRGIFLTQVMRVSCFLAIAAGIVSILLSLKGGIAGPLRNLQFSMDDALGLIFTGFALRMSRLELHRPVVRIVVKTSRICLGVIGAADLAGASVLWPLGEFGSGMGDGRFAAGIVYLLTAIILSLRGQMAWRRLNLVLTAFVGAVLVSCWSALLLTAFGLGAVPQVLRMPAAVLAILSGIYCVLWPLVRVPGRLMFFSTATPESDATHILFPVAVVVPILLAILRNQAERSHLIGPDAGLLLHVLLSTGCMAAMIVWNTYRLSMAVRIKEAVQMAVSDTESQMLAMLEAVSEPVWVFYADGTLNFRNKAACGYASPAEDESTQVLGTAQQTAILSASLFGRPVKAISMKDIDSGRSVTLQVRMLRAFLTADNQPRLIGLVASEAVPAAESDRTALAPEKVAC